MSQRTTDIILWQPGKIIQKEDWNGLEQVLEPRVYTGRQIPKTGEKSVLESCVFPVVLYGAHV
jgi:hypothetical protein